MHSRKSLVLVSVAWMVACAQAESVSNLPLGTASGGNGGSTSSVGGSSSVSKGGEQSSSGGTKASAGGSTTSSAGSSGRGTAGSPGSAGDSASTGQDAAGSAGKGGNVSPKGGATGTTSTTIAAAGRSGGGGATQAGGATLGVAGATGAVSCLETAATECESYCTGLNPGEDEYCDAVIKCWIENECDSTDPCSLNNGPCSVNTQGHGATPWNKAVQTAAICCPA